MGASRYQPGVLHNGGSLGDLWTAWTWEVDAGLWRCKMSFRCGNCGKWTHGAKPTKRFPVVAICSCCTSANIFPLYSKPGARLLTIE